MCGGGCCPDRPFVSDEICGNFNTTEAAVPLTVYTKEATVFVSGTVSVFYDRGTDATITATVTDSAGVTTALTIPQGNTISQTFDDIASLSIDTAAATGKYCLTLHYQT
ncbi:Protein of unknown function [Gracilibacillus ureilyticus]|uniref:Endospore appendages core domain-containing protein n=1 Tax=Gracilibacillus ureilyticus TaxID=531814 RepID=A0A1H9V8B3_9BACI|nr:S-Ena type endospore appendage [Gracilibacillus ureilyticus]SES17922.1 Protein of unknown function [Gracilibacillus ureilyticus]